MIKTFLVLLIFVLLPVHSSGQFFVSEQFSEKDKALIEKFSDKLPSFKSIKELQQQMLKTAALYRPESEESLHLITKVFTAIKTAELSDGINPESTALFESSLLQSKLMKRTDLQIWVSANCAFYYYTYRNYEKCFPYFTFCIKYLDRTKDSNVIEISDTYRKIAYFLTTTDEYEKAQEYLSKAKKSTPKNSGEMAGILNTLGYCMASKNRTQDAYRYYYKALKTAQTANDRLRFAKVLGSLAELEFKRKNYDRSAELLNRDIAISENLKNKKNTMFAHTLLARVYMKKNDVKNAEISIEKAREIAVSKTYFQSSEFEILNILADIAMKKGDAETELAVRRKIEQLKDSLKDSDGKETVLKVGWESQKKNLLLKLENEQAKAEREYYINIATIVFCALLVIIIIILIRSHRQQNIKKRIQSDNQILQLTIDKIKSENRLYETSKTLSSYETYLHEKNRQIEILEAEMEKAKTFSFSEKNTGDLQNLMESHLMTSENWSNFKAAFTAKYPSEISDLLTKHEDLTESNLRIILLSKLNMSNNETARLLGVTVEAVKKAKQRLRKKYGEESDAFFKTISEQQ